MIRSRFAVWAQANAAQILSLLLSLSTLAVYLQTAWFDFTNYDEYMMVLQNPVVRAGLTLQGLGWALTTSWFEYWHPLTWISHMLDCQLFGLWAGGHHLVNVGLHLANTLLLFSLLRRMTGSLGPSAFASALFALHPLKVESVAWIAERKDVLSALFFLLALHAYARYVASRSEEDNAAPTSPAQAAAPGAKRARSASGEEEPDPRKPRSQYYQRLGLLAFGCGLMVKPMVVTLPFVLLLLDFWPLRRVDLEDLPRRLPGLLREKIGFFILMFAGCVVAYASVQAGGSIIDTSTVPWGTRLIGVPLSYLRYLSQVFWPAGLMPIYPPATDWTVWKAAGAALLLLGVSGGLLVQARRAPWALMGWCIFLGMLVPTIGLVAVSPQPVADRYAYLPTTGLFIGVAWGVEALVRRIRLPAFAHATCCVGIAVLLGSLSWVQTSYWRNSSSLWSRCLEIHPSCTVALYNLGLALQSAGREAEAIRYYEETLRLKPDHLDANLNLGAALVVQKRPAQATNYFATALRLKPDYPKALANMAAALFELGDYPASVRYSKQALDKEPGVSSTYVVWGRCLSAQGNSQEALQQFVQAVRLNPASPHAHYFAGVESLAVGVVSEAISHLQEAVRLAPFWAEPRFRLAAVHASQGRVRDAIFEYRQGLRSEPDSPEALNNLAWILATCPEAGLRNGLEAVRLAWTACQRTGHKEAVLVGTLAAAYAEAGDFDKAQAMAQRAASLAQAVGNTNLAAVNERLLLKYRRGEPHRER